MGLGWLAVESVWLIALLKKREHDVGHKYLILISGNPLEEKHSAEGDWRDIVSAKLKNLKKLDGKLYFYYTRMTFCKYIFVIFSLFLLSF